MNKTITVSIAAYNVEKFIDETLSSLTCPEILDDIEIIIVNDGSKDSTVDIAKHYVEKYPNSFFLIDKKNGGYGSTINASIAEASAKYFRLLDGDDWFDKEEFTKYVKALKEVDTDLVITDFVKRIQTNKEEKTEITTYNYPSCEEKDVSEIYSMAMHSTTVKTELLKKGGVSITEHCFYTDFEFIMKAFLLSSNFTYLPIRLYQYRIWGEGQSVSITGSMKHYKERDLISRFAIDAAAKNKTAQRIIFETGILSANASDLLTSGDFKRYMAFRKAVKDSGVDLKPNLSKLGSAVFSAPHLLYRPASIIKRKQNHLTPLWARIKD